MSSTSDEAIRLIRSNSSLKFPLLVLCDQQTSGRGQPGKVWHSNQESLTFTWCVPESEVALEARPWLSLVAGLVVCDALQDLGIPDARLKWPNDVLLNRKKVCGILVEKVHADAAIYLVGIGVNVLQQHMEPINSAAANLALPATSLRESSGVDVSQHALLLQIVEKLCERIVGQTFAGVEELESRLEFQRESVRFVLPNKTEIRGVFCGVDSDGRLKIECNGKVETFASGSLLPL